MEISEKTNYPSFLAQECSYEKAKYAIQPIIFDLLSSWKKGTAEAPSAILKASMHLLQW